MAAAVQQGPETLKEAFPLLGKRLKLIAALKFLKSQDEVSCMHAIIIILYINNENNTSNIIDVSCSTKIHV